MGRRGHKSKGHHHSDSSEYSHESGSSAGSVNSSHMNMKQARERAKWFVKATHASARGTDNDGINLVGRIGIIFATASLVMYLLALINPNWAIVDDISKGGKFLDKHPYFNRVSKVKFGFYSFCLETEVEGLNHASHDVCFYRYSKELFTLHGDIPRGATCKSLLSGVCADGHCTCEEPTVLLPSGEVTSRDLNGFDHFDHFGLKAKRENIEWIVLGVLIVMVLADIFSNVLALNAIGSILGSAGGVVCMVLWSRFQKELDNGLDSSSEKGFGFIFLIMGFVFAFLGAVGSLADLLLYPRSERFGVANDGINYLGRWGGMLGGALVWMLLAAAIQYPQWATTEKLEDGRHGFQSTGLQGAYGATFGLLGYCLEMETAAFGDPQFVCMGMADEVQLTEMPEEYFNEDGTIPSKNGCEIFEAVEYCERCEFIIYFILFMIPMTLVGDVFSEKLLTNSLIMFINCVGSGLACVQWLIFKIHISGPKPYASAGKVDVGQGFFMCMFATGCALISCICFYLDYKDLCDCCANDFQQGKSKHDNEGGCYCFLCHGSGTSGYDGTGSTNVTKVTHRNNRDDSSHA